MPALEAQRHLAIGASDASFRPALVNDLFEVAAHFLAWRGPDVSGLDKPCRRFELIGQILNPVNAQKHGQIVDLVRNPLQVFQFVHGARSPRPRGRRHGQQTFVVWNRKMVQSMAISGPKA
jgi:hypothetical protein